MIYLEKKAYCLLCFLVFNFGSFSEYDMDAAPLPPSHSLQKWPNWVPGSQKIHNIVSVYIQQSTSRKMV